MQLLLSLNINLKRFLTVTNFQNLMLFQEIHEKSGIGNEIDRNILSLAIVNSSELKSSLKAAVDTELRASLVAFFEYVNTNT